jgi:hypothetical protein
VSSYLKIITTTPKNARLKTIWPLGPLKYHTILKKNSALDKNHIGKFMPIIVLSKKKEI